jgi:hypothetical protein
MYLVDISSHFRAYRSINLTALVRDTCVRIGVSKRYGGSAVGEYENNKRNAFVEVALFTARAIFLAQGTMSRD